MLSRWICAGWLIAAAMLAAPDARAERRIALVIGNSEYAHAPALRNPRNDAGDMAEALKNLGFEVVLGADLDQQAFARHIDQFARMLDGADVALFYYAGHGLQINDRNFLVSTNARLASEFLIPAETIELDAIVRLMESKTAVNLVFLDACRNNPLAEDLRRNLTALKRSASVGRGLARVEPSGRDTLIAFAAAPGQEAADGSSRNSPFTAALLANIARPGQEVSVMLKEVAAAVRRETRNAQRPQQLSDMTRTFYFAKGDQVAAVESGAKPEPPKHASPRPAAEPASPSAPSPADDRALDVAFWSAAQSANECEAVKAYLTRFPNGIFVELAKLAERRLCAPPRAAAAEPPPAVAAPPAVPEPQPQMTPAAEPSPPQQLAAAPPVDAPPVAAPPAAAPLLAAPPPASPPPAPPLAALPEPAPTPLPAFASPTPSEPSPPPATTGQPADPTQKTAVAVPPPPPAPSREASAPDPELVRSVQLELMRVGCGTGPADGRWNEASQMAVDRFNQHARWGFDPAQPTPALLAALRRGDGRVCPLECEAGYEARGNACVAAKPAPAPRTKKAARTPENRRSAAPEKRGRPKAQRERPQRERARAERPQRAEQPRQRAEQPRQRVAQPPARSAGSDGGGGGRQRCRFVPRATGGGFNGDTIEVCN